MDGCVVYEVGEQRPHHRHIELQRISHHIQANFFARGIQHCGDIVHRLGVNVGIFRGLFVATAAPRALARHLVIQRAQLDAELLPVFPPGQLVIKLMQSGEFLHDALGGQLRHAGGVYEGMGRSDTAFL
jgi:hypothetical protein